MTLKIIITISYIGYLNKIICQKCVGNSLYCGSLCLPLHLTHFDIFVFKITRNNSTGENSFKEAGCI